MTGRNQITTMQMATWTGEDFEIYFSCQYNTLENARKAIADQRNRDGFDIEKMEPDRVIFWDRLTGRRYQFTVR